MINYQFTLDFEVRDYECDFQSIVNNAVYQHYLEHTRHEFLRQNGVNVTSLAKRGTNLVVIRAEIDYLYPLQSGDKFFVGLNLERFSRLRFSFLQDIYRLPDNKSILESKIIGTSVSETGKPYLPTELEELLESL
ncbi:acyl-CoA thioesterase [Chloroflexota bacterium]